MDYSLLSNSHIFKGLHEEEIETILSEVPYRIKKFQEGSFISRSGDTVKFLLIILIGKVKGEMVDYAGRIIKIEDIPAPGALASAFIFGNKNIFPVNVIAVSDGQMLLIEKHDFLKILMKNHIVLVNFLDMISNRSQFLSEKIKFFNFKSIKGKLAHFLLQRAGKDKSAFMLEMTQNDIADYFGVARPSVARALGDLEDEGYIEAKGKYIRIKDKDGLAFLTID